MVVGSIGQNRCTDRRETDSSISTQINGNIKIRTRYGRKNTTQQHFAGIHFTDAVIAVVSLIGFFTLGKGPEIIQGQAEADEYRVSGKVPARILELRVKEGDKVKAGDTLVILEAPDVMAKLSQAQAAEQAARAISEKAQRGLAGNSCKLLSKCGRKPKPE